MSEYKCESSLEQTYVKQTDGQADERIYGRAYKSSLSSIASGSIYSLDKRRHGDRPAARPTEEEDRDVEEKKEKQDRERATEEESPRRAVLDPMIGGTKYYGLLVRVSDVVTEHT